MLSDDFLFDHMYMPLLFACSLQCVHLLQREALTIRSIRQQAPTIPARATAWLAAG